MGIGKVRMNTPERAQKPPISLPSRVFGWRSLPTVVMVMRPHLGPGQLGEGHQKASMKVHV